MSRFALGLATLALVLVTGACDDDPEPKIADPTTDPPTSEPTSDVPSSSAAPALTPEQTVREWIKRRNLALRTGVTDPVRELNSKTCKTCEYELEPIETVYAAGGYFDTPGWTVVKARRDTNFESNGEVIAALVYEAGQTVRAEGEEPIRYSREKRLAVFQLEQAGIGWLVKKIFYPQ